MTTTFRSSSDEQILIEIMRRLPPERASELVDFARFLEFQTTERYEDWLEETEEQVRASEEEWDQLLARPDAQRALRDLAREAHEDYQAGQTTDIRISS